MGICNREAGMRQELAEEWRVGAEVGIAWMKWGRRGLAVAREE